MRRQLNACGKCCLCIKHLLVAPIRVSLKWNSVSTVQAGAVAALLAKWRTIASEPGANQDFNGACVFDQVVEDLSSAGVRTWLDLFPGGQNTAILGADGRQPLLHDDLKHFLQSSAIDLSRCVLVLPCRKISS